MSKWHNQIIGTTSWLWKFGFYGSFTAISRADKFNKSRITVGSKLPTWVASKSVILEVQFSNFQSLDSGFRILPGYFQVQNQVPLCSSFTIACRAGDVQLIRQHIAEKPGLTSDSTICSGKTPLLVGIAISL